MNRTQQEQEKQNVYLCPVLHSLKILVAFPMQSVSLALQAERKIALRRYLMEEGIQIRLRPVQLHWLIFSL